MTGTIHFYLDGCCIDQKPREGRAHRVGQAVVVRKQAYRVTHVEQLGSHQEIHIEPVQKVLIETAQINAIPEVAGKGKRRRRRSSMSRTTSVATLPPSVDAAVSGDEVTTRLAIRVANLRAALAQANHMLVTWGGVPVLVDESYHPPERAGGRLWAEVVRIMTESAETSNE